MIIGVDFSSTDDNLMYTMKGNVLTKNGTFYPLEVLYETWRRELGNKLGNSERVIYDVQINHEREEIYIYVK